MFGQVQKFANTWPQDPKYERVSMGYCRTRSDLISNDSLSLRDLGKLPQIFFEGFFRAGFPLLDSCITILLRP